MKVSSENESFDFKQNIIAGGPVEEWMPRTEHKMQKSLYLIMKEAVIAYPKSVRTEWIRQFIGMSVLMFRQIWLKYEVEDGHHLARCNACI
jgi:hypothetical protein